MACLEPEGIMQQEQRFLATLTERTVFRIEGERLRLEADDGRALVFAWRH